MKEVLELRVGLQLVRPMIFAMASRLQEVVEVFTLVVALHVLRAGPSDRRIGLPDDDRQFAGEAVAPLWDDERVPEARPAEDAAMPPGPEVLDAAVVRRETG